MYKIKKVLNHNSIIAIHTGNLQEYLIMGKGIGFGKKAGELLDAGPSETIYSLQKSTDRGNARELVNSIKPLYLEIANEVLSEARRTFHDIDTNVLFPMADHIEYAVKRIQNHEEISNPLTDDIRILFHMEYKTAECIRRILWDRLHIEIGDDEIGYIALHIHSAIQDEKVSQAMQMARAVRECISLVESGNRQAYRYPVPLLQPSHEPCKEYVARTLAGEKLKLNMNDYMEVKFPQAFQTAKTICEQVGHSLRCPLNEVEIGYLAMHIERVASDELESRNE